MPRLYGAGYDVEFKVVPNEQPQYSNKVTQRPVEKEADISDHIKPEPKKLSIRAFFSGPDSGDKHQELQEMALEEEVFTYEGLFGTYENMAIDEIMPLKKANYGNGFECDIRLQQVMFVEFETVDVELGVDPETGNEVQGEDSGDRIKDSDDPDSGDVPDEEAADPTTLKLFGEKFSDIYDSTFGGDEDD